MQALKTKIRTLTAAVALGALGIGFATNASAMATYLGQAEFEITLDAVTDAAGSPVDMAGNWYVDAEGLVFSESTLAIGAANADTASNIQPFAELNTGESAAQLSASFGNATDGTASSALSTDFGMTVENLSNQELTFNFMFDALVDAIVTGSVPDGNDALASATIDIDDELGAVDVFLEAFADLIFGPTSDSDFIDDGMFSITLQASEMDFITGIIDSSGRASATGQAPEPASIALLAAGLIGVGAARRRKAA